MEVRFDARRRVSIIVDCVGHEAIQKDIRQRETGTGREGEARKNEKKVQWIKQTIEREQEYLQEMTDRREAEER